ncbi:MAG: PhzF family phenazine biosynthesis protein [Xanthomonadales bacterium]|jgi:trans-2,3-dihydro-3-hydroxyanthranilate isomerase|nr:PhzF family phenazine biosynthesis protein [Xanthomonadales bacterium]
MSTRLPYCTLDVFTEQRHAGNPLAVVFLADALPDALQHAIAREFNLSETVFVQRPSVTARVAALRIWTPGGELPFAGHPTVGTAWALGQRGAGAEFVLEERIGTIHCQVDAGRARFRLPRLPTLLPSAASPDWSRLLGVSTAQIGEVRWVSAGVPFWLVELVDDAVLAGLQPEFTAFAGGLPADAQQVYVYVRSSWRTRMFAPALGLNEDPATGSAAAALSLVIAGTLGDGDHQIRLRQGIEMGRPSQLDLDLRVAGGAVVEAWLGGGVVPVAEGWLAVG